MKYLGVDLIRRLEGRNAVDEPRVHGVRPPR
jgi:hypothetical protein